MAEIAGLKLIVPSSVAGSGVSVSASGKITFTAATSISINGCFSSAYDNYLAVFSFTGNGSGNVGMRMRLSGTDATGASDYTMQYIYVDNTTILAARQTADVASCATRATTKSGTHMYFYGPYLAQPTAFRTVQVAPFNTVGIEDRAATHNQSTSYDGWTMYPYAGNITGTMTIYGLSQ